MQLHRHQEQFAALNTDVVYVSFGPSHWIKIWKQNLESPYPILLDKLRQVYDLYNVKKSRKGVFSLKAALYHVKKMEIPTAKGDPYQMGGEFIIDSDGKIRHMHVNEHASNQTPVSTLLAKLKKINA